MRTIKSLGALLLGALSAAPVMAQQTYEEMEQLTVNEQVTTVITASEPVRFVDISTDKVVGDQPINNTIRLKPKEGADVHADGDVLAIVTIVTERYRTQYASSIRPDFRRPSPTSRYCRKRRLPTTIHQSACPPRTWQDMPVPSGTPLPASAMSVPNSIV